MSTLASAVANLDVNKLATSVVTATSTVGYVQAVMSGDTATADSLASKLSGTEPSAPLGYKIVKMRKPDGTIGAFKKPIAATTVTATPAAPGTKPAPVTGAQSQPQVAILQVGSATPVKLFTTATATAISTAPTSSKAHIAATPAVGTPSATQPQIILIQSSSGAQSIVAPERKNHIVAAKPLHSPSATTSSTAGAQPEKKTVTATATTQGKVATYSPVAKPASVAVAQPMAKKAPTAETAPAAIPATLSVHGSPVQRPAARPQATSSPSRPRSFSRLGTVESFTRMTPLATVNSTSPRRISAASFRRTRPLSAESPKTSPSPSWLTCWSPSNGVFEILRLVRPISC